MKEVYDDTQLEFYGLTSEDIENIKSDILYSSNQLQKSKNFKRYKKGIHNGEGPKKTGKKDVTNQT